ncbi:MAG: SsrA-binding protein SmpB [Termitinemataceae bacterium]|nr:MAG: SsrA-binding protein SmpB [Termitinemataceae bacterium]
MTEKNKDKKKGDASSALGSSGGIKIVGKNRRAFFDYEIDDKFECGIELRGTEVKSFREGKISFPDAWAEIVKGEIWIRQLTVNENPFSSLFNHAPERPRKLLLHKAEIKRLERKVNEKGYTLIPLMFYFKNRIVKVELGLAKGKKSFDKRASIREKDLDRDTAREFRNRQH